MIHEIHENWIRIMMFNTYYSWHTNLCFGTIMVINLCQLDLQLSVRSVPITTKSCEFESRSWRGVLDTTLCDKDWQ
jgi:hypothetical protein